MIRHSLFVTPIAVACLFASQALYASPINMGAPTNAMFARSKTVKFQLHNASAAAMDLKAGDTVVTLKAGETIHLELAPGTRIVTNSATDAHPAGTIVLEVSAGFSGSTVTLN
ncbi:MULTISPECIES: hypothetical protein [Acidobacteriaceae]|uniref:hypothetical protein n=1 Tax=Acidobacteriaceae TaxID=204434 RepID=UPI00131BBF4C|nr:MULTISPECIES: hypothetical protein [Acidobacteriaceae]MDW5265833.1 hypothetical protein [Edaphobacter sp.]